MKKTLLLLTIVSIGFTGFSQEEKSGVNQKRENLQNIKENEKKATKFMVGAAQLNFSELSTYLNVADYNKNTYYLGWGDSRQHNRFYYDGYLSFYLNQGNSISDSSRTKLAGFSYFINFGYDLLKDKKMHIYPMIGLGYQKMWVRVEEDKFSSPFAGIDKVKYTIYNPAFMFDFGLEVKVPIYKKLAFSLKGGYKLDVSNPAWKYDGDKLGVKTNLSGVYAEFALILNHYK